MKNQRLTTNFMLSEFVRPQDMDVITPELLANIKRTADMLEFIRSLLGDKQIIITSGYRTPEHNKAVGGAENSWHIKGLAADFYVVGVRPKTVQYLLREYVGGLGSANTFTHIDLGGKYSGTGVLRRWKYQ